MDFYFLFILERELLHLSEQKDIDTMASTKLFQSKIT